MVVRHKRVTLENVKTVPEPSGGKNVQITE
jgi:hypothetical protein